MARMSELAKGIQGRAPEPEAVEAMQKEQDCWDSSPTIQKKLQSGKIDDALKSSSTSSRSSWRRLEKELQQKAGQQQSGNDAQRARALREAAIS